MKTSIEYLPDGSQWASVVHGPIVLAAVTDSTILKDYTQMTAGWGMLLPVRIIP
jgi:hypothetical protein